MIHLMNSAIMTTSGVYRVRKVTESEFCHHVKQAHASGKIISYLGYQQTIGFIQNLTGIRFPFNRDRTEFSNGDEVLIIRLAYRIDDPSTKGQLQRQDYEFLKCTFETETNFNKGGF